MEGIRMAQPAVKVALVSILIIVKSTLAEELTICQAVKTVGDAIHLTPDIENGREVN